MDRETFISYSWGDGEGEKHFARAVADALIAHNFRVWLDKRHLGLGDHIDFSIAAAVSDADCFLIFLSKEGLGRIKSGRGGFTLEIEKILTVRNARRRSGHDTKIVVVTLDRLLDTELADIAQLQDIAGTLRLEATETAAKFRSTGDKRAACPVAHAIIRDVFHSELILFPRERFLVSSPDAYPLSWIGSGAGIAFGN
jgi:TIR domain